MVDVAREADVSLKTVSRVVNNETSVQAEYVERVQQAIDKLGFVRNNIARDLRSNKDTSIIGLVIGDLGNPFYSLIARSIERVARSYGSMLVICSSEEDPQRERECIVELCERRVDGLVVVPTYVDHAFCADEIKRGMRMVFLDRRPVGLQADTVLIENVAGSAAGARFLFGRGHRRIAVIGHDLRLLSMEQRLSGVREAAAEAGIELDDDLIRFGPLTPDHAAIAASELASLPDPPTAFFCCTNRITVGVVDELHRRGLELDVVGFDDLERRHNFPMPVGVITYDLEELGRQTAELLFRRIRGDRGDFEEIVVPTTLISP